MKNHIDNNTTDKNGTHFLRGVELINKATDDFNFHIENWAYPTCYSYGNPKDRYYAEVWHNGMDWNSNYWLIETAELIKPTVYPFIHFSNNDERYKYNDNDFEDLCNAIMHYRREITWIKSNDPEGYYSDTVWPFIDSIKPEEKLEFCECMIKHRIIHASQKRCEFYLNVNLIPNLKRVNHNNVIEDENVKITSQYPIPEEFRDIPTLLNKGD